MGDDDAPGGSPVCYLADSDPAYAGYLTEDELRQRLAALLERERAAIRIVGDLAAAAGATSRLAALAAALAAIEAALLDQMSVLGGGEPMPAEPRFGTSVDSPPRLVQLIAILRELVRTLETMLPQIASNACHAALNRVLSILRDQMTRYDGY